MDSRSSTTIVTAVIAAVALTLAACSASSGVSTEAINPIEPAATVPATSVPAGSPTGALDWSACTESGASTVVDLECATLSVPLDYAQPDAEAIEIAVARSVATGPGERIGSLVLNPGGPGASGIEFLLAAAIAMPPEITERFDLVSFDPRGVGSSTAVDCEIDFDDEIALLAGGDDDGWQELVSSAEERPSTCTADTVRFSPFFGTNNAARDLDRLRDVLGDEALSYVGFSYGTRLGATYAELFPDRVRALVLDGAVKPTTDSTELTNEQAASFDRAFGRFAGACDADADCAVSAIGPTFEVYSALADTIDESGSLATTDADRVLTPGELRLAVIAALYSTQLWPVLAQGLADAALDGDGTLLQTLADSYLGRRPDGSYDSSQNAGFSINCADDALRPPVDAVRTQSEEAAERTEWFDEVLRASTGCIGGPSPVDPLIVGSATGAAPILVIGTTGDPATPYEWSVEMAEVLSSAELYTVDSDGHTAFLSVPCVDRVVIDYLIDLTMPAPGGSCADPVDGDVFQPPGEGELDALVALFDCLRDNGASVPEISVGDLLADPTGEALLDAIDPTDPEFGAAVLACADLIPGS